MSLVFELVSIQRVCFVYFCLVIQLWCYLNSIWNIFLHTFLRIISNNFGFFYPLTCFVKYHFLSINLNILQFFHSRICLFLILILDPSHSLEVKFPGRLIEDKILKSISLGYSLINIISISFFLNIRNVQCCCIFLNSEQWWTFNLDSVMKI